MLRTAFWFIVMLIGSALVMEQPFAHARSEECANPFESYWQTDFCAASVPLEEIRSGGVPRDGIPPIDAPEFESVEAASAWLQPQSPVVAVEINGEAKAYPLAIMTWHEIVNDELGGEKIAITFCPLCNSALVFNRVVDEMELTFGVSGKLRNSDLVMWDRQTESWWQQFTGEGIVGQFTGTQLEIFPSLIVSFGEFSERFPDAQVLSRSTGATRPYGQNPYTGYDSSAYPFLFSGDVDPRLPALERVLAGVINGEPAAYSFPALQAEQVINDTVGEAAVVAFWQPGATSALDGSAIDDSRDIGMAALYSRVVDGETLTFSIDADGVIRDDRTGSAWNIFGEAVEGEMAGTQLEQQIAAPHFWFAWAAFQPETPLYGEGE